MNRTTRTSSPRRWARALRSPEQRPIVQRAVVGLSMFLTALAVTIYVLGAPEFGVVLFVVTLVAMLFVLTERDAALLVSVYVVGLMVVPARYVLAPLGALGAPATVIGLLAGVWWVASRANQGLGAAHGQQPVRIALLIYLWWSALCYALAFTRPLAEVEVGAATRVLLGTMSLVSIGLLAADGIRDRSRLETVLRRLVMVAGLSASFGILQFFGTDLVPYLRLPGLVLNSDLNSVGLRSDFARVAGTATHAIEFAVVLAVVAPLALHFALHGPPERRPSAWFWTLSILLALPMAVSRTAVVGIVVSLVVLSLRWSWSQRVWLGMLGVVMMLAMRVIAPGLLGTLRALFAWWGADDSIEGRTEDYGPLYNFVSESPWVGRGTGTFEPSVYFFVDNEWFLSAVNTGVVGTITLLVLFVVGVSCCRGVRRRTAEASTAHLAQALMAGLLALGVTYGTFDGLSFRISAGLLFLLLGATGALWRLEVGASRVGRDAQGRLLPETVATAPDADAVTDLVPGRRMPTRG
jgi:polysaccharide biosynthesis protein PslJ